VIARLRRRVLQAVAVLVFVILAGATYQGVATALERRRFPHPGQLADVGGHQLHLYCTGDGAPTVLLEAPAAGMSAAWGWVQPAVAEETRVCSYDRAGLGWSEAGTRAFAPAAVAAQLHALVQRAGERPPFVIVGHGFGAALATLAAARFGSDAAALVVIDPPSAEDDRGARSAAIGVNDVSPWLARVGVLRATGGLAAHSGGLPEPWADALATFLYRPDHLTRTAQELARSREVIELAAAARPSIHAGVIEVDTRDGAPFLTNREEAARVAAAIRAAVDRARLH
jgi:pimeloyl-ACP methyl ester carboxylesterase